MRGKNSRTVKRSSTSAGLVYTTTPQQDSTAEARALAQPLRHNLRPRPGSDVGAWRVRRTWRSCFRGRGRVGPRGALGDGRRSGRPVDESFGQTSWGASAPAVASTRGSRQRLVVWAGLEGPSSASTGEPRRSRSTARPDPLDLDPVTTDRSQHSAVAYNRPRTSTWWSGYTERSGTKAPDIAGPRAAPNVGRGRDRRQRLPRRFAGRDRAAIAPPSSDCRWNTAATRYLIVWLTTVTQSRSPSAVLGRSRTSRRRQPRGRERAADLRSPRPLSSKPRWHTSRPQELPHRLERRTRTTQLGRRPPSSGQRGWIHVDVRGNRPRDRAGHLSIPWIAPAGLSGWNGSG